MQALKLTIPGKFWDSYLYEGRLYLFTLNGSIATLDWDSLIQSLRVPEKAKLGFHWAFAESSGPYSPPIQQVIGNRGLRSELLRQYALLSKSDYSVGTRNVQAVRCGEQDNPYSFPHNDVQIYRKAMFVSSEKGVHRAPCSKKNKFPVGKHPSREWEVPSYCISLSYGSMMVASGEEGLFELPIWTDEEEGEEPGSAQKLVNDLCTTCDWLYHSVYGSAPLAKGHLAMFTKEEGAGGSFKRALEKVVSEEKIFGDSGFSWGSGDKIIQTKGNLVKVARYSPWSKIPDEVLTVLRELTLYAWKGEVVSGGCASFGIIIECDNALVVIPSNGGKAITVPGEPVNWRTFNRSKHYENQLHVVYDDRLEVIAFYHDFFVEQSTKSMGLRVSAGRNAFSPRTLRSRF